MFFSGYSSASAPRFVINSIAEDRQRLLANEESDKVMAAVPSRSLCHSSACPHDCFIGLFDLFLIVKFNYLTVDDALRYKRTRFSTVNSGEYGQSQCTIVSRTEEIKRK